ncbi:MAG: aldo/keto reductase [Paludibacteraceae bacterium]|nr:aldo/keto reductase [Paludibacteraceae bacterium]
MKYRQLPNTDLKVSVLSLGTATFGGSYGFEGWGHVDVAEATRMIDMALDAGINMFDTADVYSQGWSEQILGQAIQGKRDRLLIASKGGFRMSDEPTDAGSSREHLIKACEDSLRRLNVDYLDLYYVHGFDNNVPTEETVRAMDELVQSGKVRYIACSNYSGWHVMKSLAIADQEHLNRYVAHQVYYSLLNRDYEWELMPLAQDQQLGAIIWSPLAAGRLAGRYRRGVPIPEDARVRHNGVPVRDNVVHYDVLYRIIDCLDSIAEETSHPVADVALAWLLSRPTVTSLLLGARKEQHLKENLTAADLELTSEQIARLDEASAQPKAYPYWHQNLKPEFKSQIFY